MTDEAPDTERHLPDDRSLVAVANRLESVLNDDLGGTLVGIAFYEDGEYDVAYRDDAASARYTDSDVRAIMTNIQLDAIGAPAYEDHHGEPLRGTVRVYDTLVTVAVPVAETAGIVVVLRNDGSHDPYSVIETVETETA
ncbi:hypothetical protein ACFQDG_03400 [Natronoarchaeum mannanilyticum]|uniref:Roadblock/LAMTOR2 domain-containing protein n=1 Tax=Natronoarchaeum mannanilyticum TaxID=926360 RepID=A0AAV3TE71_9EURY